ncbi:RNA polymerase sigma factor [Mycobacterium sp. MMS18-G62]
MARIRATTDREDHYPDWEAVYADNAVWVYRMVFARVGNRPDAEDLTAEVFSTALRRLRMTATIAEVRGYLRATTRTVLAAHWRYGMRCAVTSLDEIPDRADNTEQVTTAASREVHAVLAVLPANYRRILELRFLQGRSIKDSATEMGISLANAKVLQHRALRRAAALNDPGL